MKPSIVMSNIIVVLTLLAVFFMATTAAFGQEELHWTYVELAVEQPNTLPAAIASIVDRPEVELEWVNDHTIVGFFSQSAIDDLSGYVEVVHVGEQRLFVTHLSAIHF